MRFSDPIQPFSSFQNQVEGMSVVPERYVGNPLPEGVCLVPGRIITSSDSLPFEWGVIPPAIATNPGHWNVKALTRKEAVIMKARRCHRSAGSKAVRALSKSFQEPKEVRDLLKDYFQALERREI